MEQAIKIAIENGWLISMHRERLMQYEIEAGTYKEAEAHRKLKEDYIKASIIADPLFWQALGKGMGWKDGVFNPATPAYGWKIKWHRFIDHLADGKDIDSFFTELIND